MKATIETAHDVPSSGGGRAATSMSDAPSLAPAPIALAMKTIHRGHDRDRCGILDDARQTAYPPHSGRTFGFQRL